MAFGSSEGAENAIGIPLPKRSQEVSLPAPACGRLSDWFWFVLQRIKLCPVH